ncbi:MULTISPECIES: peptidase domain-containing ABC transporter [Clostridium]|uniref:peptidase domain-containing ABC transporter n=2 Tax=Clostridiaceae TaxID=31979 RepID=UPI002909B3DC|nr:peptidase domain-containing ABC transporter [Clostridium sp.]MDU3525244.1 peptidase domain-containing ABC transporter [Clostridium sp.]MDU3546594.1 peptidase domain-containing ABC transporter [Clostridium sp.]MDU6364326.1 peptidase domain-containing ABC transporter [Clostridium sp.]
MRYNYLVKQHDITDCAAACIATVCMYYKKEITITKLRDILGTDIKGTTLLGLEDGAKKLGFDTRAIRVDKEGFKQKFTLPAIAHVITKEGLSHFVIVHKIKKEEVIILDPAKGKEKKKIDEFFKIFDGVLLLLIPNNEFNPGKIKGQGILSKFIQLLLPQKSLFIYSIVVSAILTVLGIASAFFNKILMDEILPYNLKNQLNIFVIGFLLLAITQIGLGAIRQHMLLYLSQKIDIPLLLGYFKHVYKLPMKFFASRKVGDILTRFSDAFTIKNILTSVSLSLIMDIVLATVSASILYVMNQKLFVVILVLTIVSAALIYIFKGPYKKINLEQMEAGARLNSQIIESLKGIETIKVHAAEENSIEKLELEYIRNLKIAFKEGVLSNIQGSISGAVSSVGNLILMYIGAMMIMKGDITLGSLMTFSTLSGYFMDPIGRLIGLQLSIQEASISLKRISEIYEVEKEQDETEVEKIKLEKIDGDIELNNITFRYGSRSPVLNDVSIKIPKGKKVALVGESGSGKTTISKLLLKYYTPEEGKINVNDYNIEELDLYNLRENIAYVPQNVELFSGSIKENITLGKTNASYEEIKSACENAGCREFIEKLPGKYGTFLEEAGGGLSGGEKQRIALARALIKKPSFLILDEATSNLDFISEAKIFDTLFKKGRNITMLMIAHRLSTIRSCDIIYVMDKGKIVEEGNHESLLKKKGYYYKLYVSQVGSLEERDNLFINDSTYEINEKNAISHEEIIEEGEEYEYN